MDVTSVYAPHTAMSTPAHRSRLRAATPPRRRKRTVALAASLFLASCEGTITTDLLTRAPADPDVQQIVVPLLGVEFIRSDGGTARITFNRAERIDVLTLDGTPMRVLANEELPDGHYTGVRLLIDTDDDRAYVIDGRGAQRDLTIVEGDYAPMDFTVEDDKNRSEELTLALDLRMSLAAEASSRYTLRPVTRSVRTRAAGNLTGTVTAACLTSNATTTAGAVYLFEGRNVTPDDADGQGVEPYATAPVLLDANGFTYRLDFLAPGDYTIAFTCNGIDENPNSDDDLGFRATANVRINERRTTQHDIRG